MSQKNTSVVITIAIVFAIATLVAIAGGVGGVRAFHLPLYSWAVIVAFLIQLLVYIPAFALRSEKFFDLTGASTYTVITIAILFLAPVNDLRSIVLATMVITWALRLGTFLFIRVLKAGSDQRFDDLKNQPIVFLRVWVLQGLWISLTAAAAWIAMTSSAAGLKKFGALESVGVAIWLFGFLFEVVADLQKSRFKADPQNAGKFISNGLWAFSRHPNYFGEIVLWMGVFLVAVPVLSGWQWVAVLSPIFVTLLLTRVSGVTMLEEKADRIWGDDEAYQEYKKNTPVLIPRF